MWPSKKLLYLTSTAAAVEHAQGVGGRNRLLVMSYKRRGHQSALVALRLQAHEPKTPFTSWIFRLQYRN